MDTYDPTNDYHYIHVESIERYWKINEGLVYSADGSEATSKVKERAPIRCHLIKGHEPCRVLQWPISLEGCTVATVADQLSRFGAIKRVLLHGLELDPETPILWLALNMAYADNFVHLVIQLA